MFFFNKVNPVPVYSVKSYNAILSEFESIYRLSGKENKENQQYNYLYR